MDEIQTRLQETSQNCLKAYEAWAGNKKDSKIQEALQAAIHELRKVSSRLEIELAVSERDQMTSKPLPIPAHRSSKGKQASHEFDDEDNTGNADPNMQPKQQRRRSGGGQGGPRRRPHPGNNGPQE